MDEDPQSTILRLSRENTALREKIAGLRQFIEDEHTANSAHLDAMRNHYSSELEKEKSLREFMLHKERVFTHTLIAIFITLMAIILAHYRLHGFAASQYKADTQLYLKMSLMALVVASPWLALYNHWRKRPSRT